MKKEIENGNTMLGTMISEFGSPNIVRILKTGGYEFVIIDCEHGPFDFTQLSGMVALANAIHMPVLVRVPGIDRGFITKVLDMGADGLLAPMINTVEDACNLVECAKYLPLGKRGASTTRAHTNYLPPKLDEYMEEANKRTIILAQIETCESVENAEKIAAVSGVDALVIGPTDLSADMGRPGDLHTPEFLSNAKRVTDAALSQGKRCGTVASNVEYLHKCQEMGMNLFCMGSELGMLLNGAKNNVNKFYKKEEGCLEKVQQPLE